MKIVCPSCGIAGIHACLGKTLTQKDLPAGVVLVESGDNLMPDIKMSTCCTCGYSWRTGMDGRHSCNTALLEKVAKLKKAICIYTREYVINDFKTDEEAVAHFIKFTNELDK